MGKDCHPAKINDPQIHPDDGGDAELNASSDVLYRTVEAISIGYRKRVKPH
jgi:hypothetical protein